MIQRLHIDPRVDKQLDVLRRAGKKADLAARRAAQIIMQLQNGALSPENIAMVTKHGELRLKGCLKYDLGSGYRLVTLKQGSDLFVLYCGTHDDCHRWIENNRELSLMLVAPRARSYSVSWEARPVTQPASEEIAEVPEKNSLPEVDERILRQIFSGLTSREPHADPT